MYEFILRLFKHNQGMRGKFWISEKHLAARQNRLFDAPPLPVNYAQLDNGKVVMYSAMSSTFADNGLKYDDVIYLGRGRYHHAQELIP
ncbi:hypothetical protein LCGC14_1942980 [marine sediment metagenome]|uniref:Uncharacterized protein n=1 Tax=marine sediment metagenome TaxID=412755 RepID=A0A0F9G8B5_9ZZZZ